MTTYSLSELGTRVLRDAGLVAADETPSAVDLDWAQETAQSELLALGQRGVNIWGGSDTSIPIEYLTPLSRWIVLAISPSFGLSNPAAVVLARREAERELRSISSIPATGAVAQTEFY